MRRFEITTTVTVEITRTVYAASFDEARIDAGRKVDRITRHGINCEGDDVVAIPPPVVREMHLVCRDQDEVWTSRPLPTDILLPSPREALAQGGVDAR